MPRAPQPPSSPSPASASSRPCIQTFHVATVLALPGFRPIPRGPSERSFPSSFPRFLPSPRLETSHQLKYGSLELPSLPHSALRRCLATALARRKAWETEAWTERAGRGSFRRRAGAGSHRFSQVARGGSRFPSGFGLSGSLARPLLALPAEPELFHFTLLERSGYLFSVLRELTSMFNLFTPPNFVIVALRITVA